MFDKFFFLNECLRYPHHVEMLISIASNSNYLSDILVINPEYFYMMTDSSILSAKLDQKSFSEEVDDRISRYSSLDAKTHAFKFTKEKRDPQNWSERYFWSCRGSEITSELSILANTLTDKLFES
jgi:glutamine synthetase adenylyltransferase